MVVNEWIRIVIHFLNMDRVKKSIFRCDWMDAINYSLTSLIKKDTIEAYLVFFFCGDNFHFMRSNDGYQLCGILIKNT
jgi:uncharacterized protein YtpQ (UPF0354 family)